MPNFYWIDATGLLGWDDALGWSSTSGGSPDTTIPTTGGSVFFDANSPGAPTAGPTVAVSIVTLNTTSYSFSLPSLVNLTVTGTLTYAADGTYDGHFGASATAVFRLGVNDSPDTLLSGVFEDLVGPTSNLGTVTTAVFNGTAFNDVGAVIIDGTFNNATENKGNATTAIFTSNQGSNLDGTVSGKITVPGIQSGSVVTMDFPIASLGTYGSLALSGASTGGGGGPLGGPEIKI